MSKQGLELTLKQTQKLSPLQIQTIKLIELPVQDLEQRIRQELESNPVLDEDTSSEEDKEEGPREVSLDTINDDDPIPSYKLKVNNYGKDERPEYNTFSVKESLGESLLEQLSYTDIDDKLRSIAEFIIGSLDSDGYLRRSLDTMADDMVFRAGIEASEEEVMEALKVIQGFEPVGVGARDLRECLLIQLRSKKPSEDRDNAIMILENHFEEFKSRHFTKILQLTGISEEQFKRALKRITRLNAAPGGQIDDSYDDQAQQIVPDFLLRYENGHFDLSMPRFKVPELRINHKYAAMLENAALNPSRENKEAASFVKKKMDSAKWFVEAIKQRHNTLDCTMRAILEFQHDYFIDGDEANLRPMVLKDIAQITGFDISTISRVVSSKYIETHFGIYPLKYFVSEGLSSSSGEEVSTREIKQAIKQCVEQEDKRKPLTDDQLVSEMEKRGYKVARRTIAKYRDQLDIPKACLRRNL
ncbi:MAG: RNA polymerase factor sigma-54 [Bacteroidales bacterium]|nr:RNA polymerase factor sigma-54 [Bacteroidales bacterium]